MDSIPKVILTVLALLVIIIFVGALYAFFYAIFQFIFSAGDPEKIKKAWNSIRYMILGIILTLIVLFFFPIILKKAKIPGNEYYTANNIFAQVSKITGWFVNLWKDAVTTYQNGWSIGEWWILIPKENTSTKDSDTNNTDETKNSPPLDNYDNLEL